MPETASPPRLRIHRSPDDAPPWPPRGDPRRPPPSAGGPVWMRYGRLPNGAAAGCFLDVSVTRGRPPAGVDARWDPAAGVWVAARVIDPAADAVSADDGAAG